MYNNNIHSNIHPKSNPIFIKPIPKQKNEYVSQSWPFYVKKETKTLFHSTFDSLNTHSNHYIRTFNPNVRRKKKCYNNNLNNIQSSMINSNVIEEQEKKSYCINCGKYGHIFKKCIFPILSFGLIGYYYDAKTKDVTFIMIQSKNTFHFLDFIRGKYDLTDIDSINRLFLNMTEDEIDLIRSKDFDYIWKQTYHDIYNLNDIQENQKKMSKNKFDYIVSGFEYMHTFYDMDYFLSINSNSKIQISWSFPKGRRNYKESDLMCAIREFEEETGFKRKFFEIKEPKKIYCETYVGDNNIEYQHRYFLAEFHQKFDIIYNENNTHQMIEIGKLKWMKKEEAISCINPFYIQRIEIVNQFIQDIIDTKSSNTIRNYNSRLFNNKNHKIISRDNTHMENSFSYSAGHVYSDSSNLEISDFSTSKNNKFLDDNMAIL